MIAHQITGEHTSRTRERRAATTAKFELNQPLHVEQTTNILYVVRQTREAFYQWTLVLTHAIAIASAKRELETMYVFHIQYLSVCGVIRRAYKPVGEEMLEQHAHGWYTIFCIYKCWPYSKDRIHCMLYLISISLSVHFVWLCNSGSSLDALDQSFKVYRWSWIHIGALY